MVIDSVLALHLALQVTGFTWRSVRSRRSSHVSKHSSYFEVLAPSTRRVSSSHRKTSSKKRGCGCADGDWHAAADRSTAVCEVHSPGSGSVDASRRLEHAAWDSDVLLNGPLSATSYLLIHMAWSWCKAAGASCICADLSTPPEAW